MEDSQQSKPHPDIKTMKPQTPLRTFIDLSGHEYWHRRQFEDMQETMRKQKSKKATLVASADQADCVLKIGGCPSLKDGVAQCLKWPKKKEPPEFVWEM